MTLTQTRDAGSVLRELVSTVAFNMQLPSPSDDWINENAGTMPDLTERHLFVSEFKMRYRQWLMSNDLPTVSQGPHGPWANCHPPGLVK